jgi:hypothetical protein
VVVVVEEKREGRRPSYYAFRGREREREMIVRKSK